jgi:bacillithiol system protein YtxJ
MADIQPITDINEWITLWEAEKAEDAGALLVFKRSPICPTSHFVEGIFNRYVKNLPESKDLKIISVDVVGARPLSQRIAADTKIKHESPQALLISRGQNVLWNASHGAIDDESLTKALAVAKV